MAIITEDYVNFETAKLLKEKGFDEHCFCINYPLPEGGHHNIILPNLLNNSMIPFTDEYKFCRYKEDFITIPTLQMAMKWLREVHGIFIQIELYSKYDNYNFEIFQNTHRLLIEERTAYNTYTETVEMAIKHCLKHLIK